MVVTRAKSTVVMPLTEKILQDTKNMDESSESLIMSLCTDLNKLVANHSGVNFSDLEVNIACLVKALDESLATSKELEIANSELQLEKITLEARIEQEVQKRHLDLNESFNAQDSLLQEKDNIIKENSELSCKLVMIKTNLKLLTEECSSLKLLVSDKDTVISGLNNNLNACNKRNSDLLSTISGLKSKVHELDSKSWNSNRWLDDKILDSYFDTFSESVNNSFRKTLFIGPTISQLIKHGSDGEVAATLNDLAFASSDYAFLCVSDNPAVLKEDTGSHWTLLFVDIGSKAVFHFDSLTGANGRHTRLVAGRFDFSFTEVDCAQQKNNFECGLNVLVNCKLVNEGYCKGNAPASIAFLEWCQGLHAPPCSSSQPVVPTSTTEVPCSDSKVAPTIVHISNSNSDKDLMSNSIKCHVAPMKPFEKWENVNSKIKRLNKSKKTVYSFQNKTTVSCSNRFQALEETSSCVNDAVICNASGKWQSKLCKRSTNIPRSNVNISGQRDSREAKETRSHSNVLHSNVRGRVSNGKSGPKCLKQSLNEPQTSSMSNVLLIGDSLLRHSGKRVEKSGAVVDVNPGAKICHIKDKLKSNYESAQPDIIYLLVGTNNLVRGYNGGPGYNGGWGKREALHSMADLLSTAKKIFPNSVIVVNSVLTRQDISKEALFHFNEQLMLMCNNFSAEFLDTTDVIRHYHLARDGTHLNRKGNEWFGNLIFHSLRIINEAVSNAMCPSFQPMFQGAGRVMCRLSHSRGDRGTKCES
ncbi:SUMO1 sentrin specific peptidase 8 [Homalodisca vitripennis]|nr:SUMO1 sentrin specific peptidase 8 [Homalodisca vitripennis]